jgi:hypothetical protein
MKRTAILALAILMLAAIGCGGQGALQDDPNTVFVDPNAVRGGEYGELYFEANGVRFGIYDEAEAVFSALPAYRSTFTGETCAFDAADVYYYYSGFQIMTNEIDGVSRITAIAVADDTVKTPQGLYIGMSEEDAAEAFPALQEADWNLVDGSATLSVTIVDGVVTGIVYSPSIAED